MPAIAAPPQTAPHEPLDSRRNRVSFAGDMASFGIGVYFMPVTTVLVGLASSLTTDNALIGLVSMSWTVGWYLPQFVMAQLMHGRPRLKPFLIGASLIGRQTILLLSIWLLLTQASAPTLTVWVIIACVLGFSLTDGLTSMAWFEILARALSPGVRARTTATGMFIGSIGSIVPGLIVARLLSPNGPEFPNNYAAVFLCAWFVFQISTLFLARIKEVPETHHDDSAPAAKPSLNIVATVRESWTTNPAYRKMMIARTLTFIEVMASPFYVVFIREKLGLDDSAVGVLNTAYVIGSIVAAIVFGWLAQRFGAHRVSQTAAFLHAFCALTAFAVAVVPALAPISFALFVLVIGSNGALNKQMMLGWIAYSMDISTSATRSNNIATINTVSGLISLTPALGGVIIDALTRSIGANAAYAMLFGGVGALAMAGALYALRLPTPPRLVRLAR